MEQLLLLDSDVKEFIKTYKSLDLNIRDDFHNGFLFACSYKNNQMQEFDKWKGENGWKFDPDPYVGGKDYIYFRVRKSFSELFEIFIKETLNK